jgi:DNA-binding beta-propeller fold protein YncE
MTRFAFALLLANAFGALASAQTIALAHGPNEKFVTPFGVDFGPDGTLYVVEMAKGERLRKIAHGAVVTLAGTKEKGNTGDGEKALNATFNGMHSLAVGADGIVYLADTWNNRIRTFDPKSGTVAKFAGTGEKGFSGDGGPADEAKFGGVFCIAFDAKKENLYVTDLDNRRIRKIEMTKRIVSTVAGNGQKGTPLDGARASDQPLVDPRAAAVDSKGNLYILERGGHALRVVDAAGAIRTVAGTGKGGAGGLGGPAILAGMNGPKHLCIDKDDSVLIADTENHRIVRYVPAKKTLEAVAGSGRKGPAFDADPKKIELSQPHGVTVHPKTGELFITDSYNNRILKIAK